MKREYQVIVKKGLDQNEEQPTIYQGSTQSQLDVSIEQIIFNPQNYDDQSISKFFERQKFNKYDKQFLKQMIYQSKTVKKPLNQVNKKKEICEFQIKHLEINKNKSIKQAPYLHLLKLRNTVKIIENLQNNRKIKESIYKQKLIKAFEKQILINKYKKSKMEANLSLTIKQEH